jgi:hypothetical protein
MKPVLVSMQGAKHEDERKNASDNAGRHGEAEKTDRSAQKHTRARSGQSRNAGAGAGARGDRTTGQHFSGCRHHAFACSGAGPQQRHRIQLHTRFPQDTDIARSKISILVPIATVLLGYRGGDEIEWPTPGGDEPEHSVALYRQSRERDELTNLKSRLNEQEKVAYGRELPGEALISTTAEGEMK